MPDKPRRYRVVPRVVLTATRRDPVKPRSEWGWIRFEAGDIIPRDVPKRARAAGLELMSLPDAVLASMFDNEALEAL